MSALHAELHDLGRCFFHEDYRLEFANADEAVLSFAREQGQEAVEGLVAELNDLLASPLTEDQLAAVWINDVYANYDPREDGMTYREWFAHVRELLTQPKAD